MDHNQLASELQTQLGPPIAPSHKSMAEAAP
jgi:hypothetical protein